MKTKDDIVDNWLPRYTGEKLANFGEYILLTNLRYRVMVEEESLTERAKVVYFDDRGEMISQEYGVPGGGFMLLGLKDGFRTVLIEAEGSGRVYAVTVLVQEGVPAMVSHWLR